MKKFKILSVLLLFFSFAAYAATTELTNHKSKYQMPDETHPFLKLGSIDNNSASIWIGAFAGMLPYKTIAGDIVIIALIKSEISSENHPKGQAVEYAILASCKDKIAKILPFWEKSDELSPGVNIYNLTGEDLNNMIAQELNKQEVNDIAPGSIIEIAVSSGCHYLGEEYTPAIIPEHKKKPREWSA